MSMSGVLPAILALFIIGLNESSVRLLALCATASTSSATSRCPFVRALAASLPWFRFACLASSSSLAASSVALRFSLRSRSMVWSLFRFRLVEVVVASCRGCLSAPRPQLVMFACFFLAARAGSAAIHASFSVFLLSHIVPATCMQSALDLANRLCIAGLSGSSVLMLALGTSPDAVQSGDHPLGGESIHECLFHSWLCSAQSSVSLAFSLPHSGCACGHSHIAWWVDSFSAWHLTQRPFSPSVPWYTVL